MEPFKKLPRELRKPFDVRRCDAADRLAMWNRWELAQWIEATRVRGLAFPELDVEIQRRLVAAIDERPPVSYIPVIA